MPTRPDPDSGADPDAHAGADSLGDAIAHAASHAIADACAVSDPDEHYKPYCDTCSFHDPYCHPAR
jgi:hypothetical protein